MRHSTAPLAAVFALTATLAATAQPPPDRTQLEPWLGTWTAGRETLVLRWDGGLVVELDAITLPGDGRWHETVPTFAVRHRVTWIAERGVLRLEERHDDGAHWRYELRRDGDRLQKLDTSAEPATLVRTYVREKRQP